MENILPLLERSPLFQEIKNTDIEKIQICLKPLIKEYEKHQVIISSGSIFNSIGMVLSGTVLIQKESASGKPLLLAELCYPELFAETFVWAGIKNSPVTVEACEKTSVLFIECKKIISFCSSACPFHKQLILNIMEILAKKNLFLNQKLDILSKANTREKIFHLLNSYKKENSTINLPYNREKMAQFLAVDRSALSRELSKMQKEGYIRFSRNSFEILKNIIY